MHLCVVQSMTSHSSVHQMFATQIRICQNSQSFQLFCIIWLVSVKTKAFIDWACPDPRWLHKQSKAKASCRNPGQPWQHGEMPLDGWLFRCRFTHGHVECYAPPEAPLSSSGCEIPQDLYYLRCYSHWFHIPIMMWNKKNNKWWCQGCQKEAEVSESVPKICRTWQTCLAKISDVRRGDWAECLAHK